MEEIKVEFETITPLFTGNVEGKCLEIKPSAIMGSLRFWFEVYCHFAGINVSYEKENLDYNWFKSELEKKVKEGLEKNQKIDTHKIAFEIAKNKLTLPSLIFGCTGWKSRIEIESIKYLDDYCFGNRLGLPDKICIKKRKEAKGNCPKNSNDFWSVWYLSQPYFFGKFEITFRTTREIKSNILLPLLNFIQKYGFIGAKNNIGYGRVIVLNPDVSDFDVIETSKFLKENKDITKNIFEEKDLPQNLNKLNYSKIEVFRTEIENSDLESTLKQLIEKKAKLRSEEKDKNIRHYKFGSVAKDIYKNKKYNIEIKGPNATKIIPLILKENNNYVGRFLSIWGIQNFGANDG
jgi:CRISPR-associated protein Cmr1